MQDSDFAGSFNATIFEDAIRQTMRMGMPEDEAERLTWHWNDPSTATPASPAGNPYSWEQTDPETEPEPGVPATSLIVDYALEVGTSAPVNTLAGTFENPRSTVTLLEDDYQLVKESDYCTIGTSTYRILYHQPTIGLFGVSVHQFVIQAQDEA